MRPKVLERAFNRFIGLQGVAKGASPGHQDSTQMMQ